MDNMSQIGIEQIGCYVPSQRLDNRSQGGALGATEDFIEQKLGFLNLAKKGEQESTSDLCCAAYEDLQSKATFDTAQIGCLMVVTQNPDSGGIPHTSAFVHQKLGLPKSIACCDISLGCTGYVHAASLMTSFMRENDIASGLLFTADPYSVIIDPADRDTTMLFGDGATCTLFSRSPRYRLGRSRFTTGSKFSDAIRTQSDADRTLVMNGSDVFRFVAKHVPPEVKRCLADNQLELAQVDRFLIHQGSKFIVETIAKALEIENERMQFTAHDIGNTVSSSVPIMLAALLEETPLPRTVLAAGFGVGLSSFVSTLHQVTD